MKTAFGAKHLVAALTAGTSLVALLAVSPALAQQNAQSDQPVASSSGGLEEIVVTARRKEEKAQSVPIAISNLSADQLSEQRILQPGDILKSVTGVTAANVGSKNALGLNVGGGFGNGYQWLRGVPGIIPYWADVPTVASGGLTFDLSALQVLKGPQGTLFGQSTNGGAFIYLPKLPTNSFEGYVTAEAGDYGHLRLEGIINIPVIDDKVLVRIGGRTNHTDGYQYDIAHKTWIGSEGSVDGRLAITFRPTDDIQNDFIGNTYSYSDNPAVAPFYNVNSPVLAAINVYAGLAPNTCGTSAACVVTYGGPLGWYAVRGNANVPYAPFESGHYYNLVNTTRWDISDTLTLKNIAGYTEGGAGTGYSGSSVTLNYPPSYFGNPIISWPSGVGIQASDEFQVLGKAFDDKLSFTAGAFYLYNQGSTAPHVVNIACSRVTLGGIQNGGVASSCSGTTIYSTDRTEALYAQATYDLSDFVDGLSFTGGARYTWDLTYGSVYQYLGTPQNGNTPQVVTSVAAGWGGSESSKAAGYSLSLDWQIDSKTLLYVTNSKGFSRGGLNLTATLPPGPGRFFAPESLSNVEGGIKADWDLPWDMKARTNVSYFYGFYDNIQVSAATPIVDAVGNVTSTVLTQNAATAHLDGFDFDLTFLPTDTLSISGGGVWTHANYDQYNYCAKFVGNPPVCAPGQLYDISGSQLIWDPKWTWRVRVAYILPVDESLGKVTLGAVLNHLGGSYSSTGYNPPAAGWPSIPPQDYYSATNNVDMSLVWTEFLGRQGIDVAATVENLFNTARNQAQYASHWLASGGSTLIPAPPRMWTVSLKYSFGP